MGGARWLAAAWTAAVCFGQTKIDPTDAEGRKIVEAFESNWTSPDRPAMRCRAQPLQPRMGFSFRFWTGFQAFLPLEGFLERETRLVVLMRVRAKTKKGPGEPSYFIEGGLLPEISKRQWREAVFSGGVYIGPGDYEVAFIVGDDRQRVCKQQWTVQAKGSAKESALAPGQIDGVGLENWRGLDRKGKDGPRVTVFMHAAPRWRGPNFVKLNGYDRMLLLNSLTSLLDLSGFASARVIAYDAQGRRVLFRDDKFSQTGYRKLSQTLRDTGYGTIDYKILTKGPSEAKFLADLIEDDRRAETKSDVVVFLGPELRSVRKLPAEFEGLPDQLPKAYYLALGRDVVTQGDMISKLVKAARGKTYLVLRSRDLLGPIRAVAQAK